MREILVKEDNTKDSEIEDLEQQCRMVDRDKKRMIGRMEKLFFKYE